MSNYVIVLFKNRIKKKIIKKFVTYKRAKEFYDKLIDESNDVWFEVKHSNGDEIKYEISILEKDTNKMFPVFTTDEFGRNIIVELEDPEWNVIHISNYKTEEEIFDCQTNNRISVNYFIKKYLGKDGIKMLSKLNNKVVLQKDDDVYLFSLKNEKDSKRFLDCLEKRFVNLKRSDVMIAYDFSSSARKYIYRLLEEKGFDKGMLYRKYTTHPRSTYK